MFVQTMLTKRHLFNQMMWSTNKENNSIRHRGADLGSPWDALSSLNSNIDVVYCIPRRYGILTTNLPATIGPAWAM